MSSHCTIAVPRAHCSAITVPTVLQGTIRALRAAGLRIQYVGGYGHLHDIATTTTTAIATLSPYICDKDKTERSRLFLLLGHWTLSLADPSRQHAVLGLAMGEMLRTRDSPGYSTVSQSKTSIIEFVHVLEWIDVMAAISLRSDGFRSRQCLHPKTH
ncbi:hypothetical protein B0H65DRAFT_101834 [Neurospora tetraspora]|uniref:Uncharacterized protein n=1 Tax=Neurospora tetraspora TaxID=94610 RepID=A0AAE0JK87_9PEZI|nr:hypothetical protein B0H65DRAFT_101834 [Neurospora tetraspora]